MTAVALKQFLFPELPSLTFDMIQVVTVTRAFCSMVGAHFIEGFPSVVAGTFVSPVLWSHCHSCTPLLSPCSVFTMEPSKIAPAGAYFACCSSEDLASDREALAW